MRLLEIILARVAYVKNVRNAQCFDHLSVHCVLPLPQIDFLGVHLTAEAFFLSDTWLRAQVLFLAAEHVVWICFTVFIESL